MISLAPWHNIVFDILGILIHSALLLKIVKRVKLYFIHLFLLMIRALNVFVRY